jgi:hypothetical protein
MLHITNGDAAVEVLQQAGIPGEFLPWRDVLHEGPVLEELSPDELDEVRAAFLADVGWGDFSTLWQSFSDRRATLEAARGGPVALWFEHDLYDQFQLIQVLSEVKSAEPPAVIVTDDFLTRLEPAALLRAFEERSPIPAAEWGHAHRAWRAFRSPTEEPWRSFLEERNGCLRHLPAAFRRLLEELPAEQDGLSRTERQILEAVEEQQNPTPAKVFRACQEREEAAFLGDWAFTLPLRRLTEVARPLLHDADGARLTVPRTPEPPDTSAGGEFWHRPLQLTEDGHRCLAGEVHYTALNELHRWLGGVLLAGGV